MLYVDAADASINWDGKGPFVMTALPAGWVLPGHSGWHHCVTPGWTLVHPSRSADEVEPGREAHACLNSYVALVCRAWLDCCCYLHVCLELDTSIQPGSTATNMSTNPCKQD